MVFKQIFVLVALCAFSDALRWKNCDSSSAVQIKVVNLSPDPVVLRKGAKVSFGGELFVRGNAGTKYKLHLKIQRKAWFWITIPCISGKYGSCKLDLDCNKLWELSPNENKQCPLNEGVHTLPNQSITLPSISLPSFLTSGHYFVRGDLREAGTNRRVACAEVYIDIKS